MSSIFSEVGYAHFLVLAAVLFAIGVGGVLLRRNALIIMMSIELMLNAANVVLLAFARTHGNDVRGTVFYLFIIGVAACEAAVGLALVIAFHRHRQTTDADRADLLKQ